jgi:hypothetical protein
VAGSRGRSFADSGSFIDGAETEIWPLWQMTNELPAS